MPPPPPPPVQYWTQFLSSALSQRGPNALPYAEDAKWLIRHHLISLVEAFPSLPPKSSHFTHNDGRSAHLLQAEGTIPIVYGGAVYNIPAVIWLLESYPRSPPSVYLTPTRDMVIKPGHPHVDRSGHVNVPYLRSWVFPSSNLVDLVRTLSRLFGQDPPLYTRDTSSSPTANPNIDPHFPHPSQPSPSPTPQQPPPPRSYAQMAPYAAGGRFPQSSQHQGPMDDPAVVYKKNAIDKILDMVRSDTIAMRKSQEVEMEGLFGTQAILRRRDEELSRGLREMLDEKEALEQQLQLVLMNTDVLEGWIRDNQGKKRMDEIDVDDLFEPCDQLSKQLVECAAADLAVEDAIYSLDKAMQEGSMPFDLYLKNIRVLSRDQFFQRATSTKVRASQVQAQVASMASRAPQYAT